MAVCWPPAGVFRYPLLNPHKAPVCLVGLDDLDHEILFRLRSTTSIWDRVTDSLNSSLDSGQ